MAEINLLLINERREPFADEEKQIHLEGDWIFEHLQNRSQEHHCVHLDLEHAWEVAGNAEDRRKEKRK